MKRPSLYWGFPVASGHRSSRRKGKRKGVALMIAVFALTMVMLFTADLIVSSQVSLELTVRSRDDVKAEYMAKSAINLGLFLLTADYGLDLFLAGPNSPMKTAPSDSRGDIWALLNGMPIGGATLEMLGAMQENFDLNKVNDSDAIDLMKLFDGEFVMNITDENAKININFLAKGRADETKAMMMALMSCPVEQEFLDFHNIKADEMVDRIKDYIDDNDSPEPGSGSSDEDEFYTSKEPSYKAKNAPLDSIEELRMIEGWNDEMHAVFSRYFTLYPFKKGATDKHKMNINTASRAMLGCLMPKSKVDCNEASALAMQKSSSDKVALVSNAGQLKQTLEKVFCHQGDGTARDASTWFDVRSKVFRIEATGDVNDQRRRLVTIIERRKPDVKKKETASYKYLYWKMM